MTRIARVFGWMSGRVFASLAGVLVAAGVGGAGGACSSGEDAGAARARKCEQLRDHMIDVRLADASGVDKAAHRDAMKHALGDSFMASCGRFDDAHLACALASADQAGLTACTPR